MSALKRGSATDNILTVAGMIGVSIPEFFFFGLVAILVFAINLGWLPVGGRLLPSYTTYRDHIPNLVMPALVLSIMMTAGVMRYARSAMLDTLSKEFIKTARSKGLPEWRVNLLHGFRVALTPVVVLIGFRLPILIGGSVIVEQVFQWPGLAHLLSLGAQQGPPHGDDHRPAVGHPRARGEPHHRRAHRDHRSARPAGGGNSLGPHRYRQPTQPPRPAVRPAPPDPGRGRPAESGDRQPLHSQIPQQPSRGRRSRDLHDHLARLHPGAAADPVEPDGDQPQGHQQTAFLVHWFGTDKTGRDVFARVLYGGRISILVGLGSALVSALIGVIIGCYAGYVGGWVDAVAMRVSEAIMAFPEIILVLVLVSILGQSLFNIMAIFILGGWCGIYRLVRAQMLSLREEEYVQALRSFGLNRALISFKHMLPNALGPVMVSNTSLRSA